MKSVVARSICIIAVLVGAGMLAASPVIDDSPTRVQTTLDPGLELVGVLRPKAIGGVSASRWTLDCAGIDREHADWRSVCEYVAPLGIARIRQQAGWARCEKDPGIYDFAWLDQVVFDAKRRGIDTWLELSYGNPAYPGGGGRQLSAGFPSSAEGLAAWFRWVEKITRHYRGVVRDWCIWNEPDNLKSNTPEFAADFAIRTAEVIKREIPDARIAAFALGKADVTFVEPFVRELERRGEARLFETIAYHQYRHNPDNRAAYALLDDCQALIDRHAPNLKLMEGEGGTQSEWCGSGALSKHPWTEFKQAKYDLRRALGDLGHGHDTSVFHLCDLEYRTSGFHDGLVRYGLVKTTGQADGFRVLKVKMAYYAIQNAVAVFNDALECLDVRSTSVLEGAEDGYVCDWRDRQTGTPVIVFWKASAPPSDSTATEETSVVVKAMPFKTPVWVDVLTGNAWLLPRSRVAERDGAAVYRVPLYDSPTFVTDLSLLTLDTPWLVSDPAVRVAANEACEVTGAEFFGPCADTAAYASRAELMAAGKKSQTISATRGVLDFAPLSREHLRQPEIGPKVLPPVTGYVSFRVRAPEAMNVPVFVQCDWFWQFFVNGAKETETLGGERENWVTAGLSLKKGWNEILVRTKPGKSGEWFARIRLGDRRLSQDDISESAKREKTR